jgi:hypothetical protein
MTATTKAILLKLDNYLLHPAKKVANYATPRCLLLLPVINGIAITTTNPSLLLPFIKDAPAIMTTISTHAQNLLLPSVQDDPAITMTNHANFKLQLIVEYLLVPRVFERSAIMTATHANLLLLPVRDSTASMVATLANLSLQLIVVIFCKISFHFCEDCRIFCEGEYQVKNDGYAINKQYQVKDDGYAINKHHLPLSAFGLISSFGHNLAFGIIMAFGIISFSGFGFVGLIIRNGLIGLIGINGLISHMVIGHVGPIDCIGLNGHIGRNGLIDHVGFVSHTDLASASINSLSLISLVCIGLIGFIGLGISFIGLGIGYTGLIGLIGFGIVGYTGLVGLISLIGLGLISLVGHIGLIGLVGLIDLGGISIVGLVDLGGISLVSLMDLIGGHISHGLGLVGLIGLNGRIGLNSHIDVVGLINSMEFEIPCYLFVREGWLWCVRRLCSLARLDSDFFFRHGLQYAKQLFYSGIPQTTKYFVMRECEDIPTWNLYAVTQHLLTRRSFLFLNSPRGLCVFLASGSEVGSCEA